MHEIATFDPASLHALVGPGKANFLMIGGLKYTVAGGKLYNPDGKIAVLYSPGYGSGWTTSGCADNMVYAPLLAVGVLLNATREQLDEAVALTWPGERVYAGGLNQLSIQWLTPGTPFRIDEYDGSESIEVYDSDQYTIA